MLIVLVILLIIVGIGIWIFGDWCSHIGWKDSEKSKIKSILRINSELFELAGGALGIIAFVALMIMLFILPVQYCGKDATVAENNERYKALIYKVESGACRDELGLLSKEVIDEIQEWNESAVRNQRLQNDFWIGVFVPDIYDKLETIDYERYQ
jgi:hypothetical protein